MIYLATVLLTAMILSISFLKVATYGNSFGTLFRVTTFGESHGKAVGVTIDGCPPRIPIDICEIQYDLDRRKPGVSRVSSTRKEDDSIEILSGLEGGITTGSPICLVVQNTDQRSKDYEEMQDKYRPSHADATYDAKYGIRSILGGGRSSARETVGRVAAGSIAKKVLQYYCGYEIIGYVKSVQDISANINTDTVTLEMTESNIMRCPDQTIASTMIARVDEVRKRGDSIGGVVEVVARNIPSGLGGPVFEKLEAKLAQGCMSIPAARGFEIGSGFGSTILTGKTNNDEFYVDDNKRIRTINNKSGGIQGGISNGEDIILRVAFKPTSTIGQLQQTVTRNGDLTTLRGKGRHDPCILPRAVPIVESMVSIVIVDALLCHHGQCELFPTRERFNRLGKQLPPSSTV